MESKFKFLTKYSLKKNIKNKWFLVVNIILAIVVIGLVNIDSIVTFFGGDFEDDLKIKIIDNTGYYDRIKTDLNVFNKEYLDSKLKISKEKKSLDKAKEKLKDTEDILLVINNDENNVYNVDFISDAYVDTIYYQTIIMSLNTTKSSIALEKSNIDPAVLAGINTEIKVNRLFLDESKTKDEENSKMILSVLSLVFVLPCFVLIVYLVQMIGAEINEEKSTRGMEIIIGNVSAKTHFFSKVLASNLFVLLQGLLLLSYGAIGLIIRLITSKTSSGEMVSDLANKLDIASALDMIKNSGIIDKLGYIIPLILILIVLSFIAYSLLGGILASMTTNMENFQQLQTPIMLISVIGYYLILISTAFPGALFMKIASCIPLLSVTLAPSLLISGEISVSIIIIAIVLLLILNYILIKYGLRIYKVGILNYSETDLWKKMFKAIKQN